MIEEIKMISNPVPDEFFKRVGATVEELQKSNLEVEVQYAHSNNIYSALIFGRRK